MVARKAGCSQANGVVKFFGACKAGGDCPAVQTVDSAEDKLDKVKGEEEKLLDEVLRLRTQLVNLTSTVKTNKLSHNRALRYATQAADCYERALPVAESVLYWRDQDHGTQGLKARAGAIGGEESG